MLDGDSHPTVNCQHSLFNLFHYDACTVRIIFLKTAPTTWSSAIKTPRNENSPNVNACIFFLELTDVRDKNYISSNVLLKRNFIVEIAVCIWSKFTGLLLSSESETKISFLHVPLLRLNGWKNMGFFIKHFILLIYSFGRTKFHWTRVTDLDWIQTHIRTQPKHLYPTWYTTWVCLDVSLNGHRLSKKKESYAIPVSIAKILLQFDCPTEFCEFQSINPTKAY